MENTDPLIEETNETKNVVAGGTKVINPINPDVKPEETVVASPVASDVAPESKVLTPEPTFDTSAIYSQPVTGSALEAAELAANTGVWQRWTGQTRAYLAEYAVLLIVLSSLIYLVNSLFGGLIDGLADPKHTWYWSGSWAYKASLAQLAATLALIPVLVLLTKRTGGTEDSSPDVKNSSWRKAFLGVFLISLGLTAVGYTVGFIYVLASAAANAGLSLDTDTQLWQALVKDGFAIIFFGLSALLYARDYRQTEEGNLSLWRKIHRYGLVVMATVFAVIFVVSPLQKQRNAYVDDLIVGDISAITSKISSYSYQKSKLPGTLNDVDLSKEVKARSESLKYEYKPGKSGGKYQICATFKTEAPKDEEVNPIAAFSGVSTTTSDAPDKDQSPRSHKKGYQCFDQTASGVRSSSSRFSTPSQKNLFEDLNSGPDSTYDNFDYDSSSNL